MRSRAELLAELENNRHKNKKLRTEVNTLSILDGESGQGYDPYDNPGTSRELPDGIDPGARHRKRRG